MTITDRVVADRIDHRHPALPAIIGTLGLGQRARIIVGLGLREELGHVHLRAVGAHGDAVRLGADAPMVLITTSVAVLMSDTSSEDWFAT